MFALVYELYVHNKKDDNCWIPGYEIRVQNSEFFSQIPTALDYAWTRTFRVKHKRVLIVLVLRTDAQRTFRQGSR